MWPTSFRAHHKRGEARGYRYLGTVYYPLSPKTIGVASVFYPNIRLAAGTCFRVSMISVRLDVTGGMTIVPVLTHVGTSLTTHVLGAAVSTGAVDTVFTYCVGGAAGASASVAEPGGVTLKCQSMQLPETIQESGSSEMGVGLIVVGTNAADAVLGAAMAIEFYEKV